MIFLLAAAYLWPGFSAPEPGGTDSKSGRLELTDDPLAEGLTLDPLEGLPLKLSDPDPQLDLSVSPTGSLTLAMRTEQWDTEYGIGIHAVEWFFLNAHKTITLGANTWDMRLDDAVGGGLSLSGRWGRIWVEQWFDYSDGVLSSFDKAILRTLGLNIGFIVWMNEWDRAGFYYAPMLIYPEFDLKDHGVSIPGRFVRSWGNQFGFRWSKVFAGGRTGTPDIGLSGDLSFRFAELDFHGDPGIPNSRMGGPGFVLSVGFFIRF